MEVTPVLKVDDQVEADSACEELRAHGIKCDTFAPDLPDLQLPMMYTGGPNPDPGIQVVVAPEDESRAKEILDAWLRSPNEESADASENP